MFLPVLMLDAQLITSFLIDQPNNTWWRIQAFKSLTE